MHYIANQMLITFWDGLPCTVTVMTGEIALMLSLCKSSLCLCVFNMSCGYVETDGIECFVVKETR